MANEKRQKVESAEERTERWKSEQLRQCFYAVEMALTIADQETATADAATTKAHA